MQELPVAAPLENCVGVRTKGAEMQSVPPWNGAALVAEPKNSRPDFWLRALLHWTCRLPKEIDGVPVLEIEGTQPSELVLPVQ